VKLKKGCKYKVSSVGLPLVPVFLDDFGNSGELDEIYYFKPGEAFTVVDIRRPNGIKTPWYLVMSGGDKTGWINGVALFNQKVSITKNREGKS